MELIDIINKNRSCLLWQPHSWRDFPAAQQPSWESESATQAVETQLRSLPGLVGAQEIEDLKKAITEASRGERFLLQAGDCAERFQDCREEVIRAKIVHLLQMALVIGFAGQRSVVPIGRMAGQFTKPRSDDFEVLPSGEKIPVFRGDSIHSFEATKEGRRADPLRLLQAYHSSSATLNFVRTQMASGLGELRNLDHWDLGKLRRARQWKRIEAMASSLKDSLNFISAMSGDHGERHQLRTGFKDFFVSHEALLLSYEEALTRFVPHFGRYYNLSAHMVWIGDRTRQLDGAHVEYCRGIGNPIGIKVGAQSSLEELLEILERINPHYEPGKVVLITRLGAQNVEAMLPKIISGVQKSGLPVTWSVDPMHGNTVRTSSGRKTRRFDDIMQEIKWTFEAHRQQSSILGGVHLELTADDVTECVGGAAGIFENDLAMRYETWCDPRLNRIQSLEAAFTLAGCLRGSLDS